MKKKKSKKTEMLHDKEFSLGNFKETKDGGATFDIWYTPEFAKMAVHHFVRNAIHEGIEKYRGELKEKI